MSKEVWVRITPDMVGFNIDPGYYVSNIGRIASTLRGSFSVLKPHKGSLYLFASNYGGKKFIVVKNVVMAAFGYDTPGPEYYVSKIDKSKGDSIDNLTWKKKNYTKDIEEEKSQSDNEKLIESGFKLLATEKYSIKEVSDMTGLNYSTTYNMARGRTWKALYEKYNLANKNIPIYNRKKIL